MRLESCPRTYHGDRPKIHQEALEGVVERICELRNIVRLPLNYGQEYVTSLSRYDPLTRLSLTALNSNLRSVLG